MTERIASLFQEALHPFWYEGTRLSTIEMASELASLTYRQWEGDVSVDVLAEFCQTRDLGLRGRYARARWVEFAGEVNIGIGLYYLIGSNHLRRVVKRQQGWGNSQLAAKGRFRRLLDRGMHPRMPASLGTETAAENVARSVAPQADGLEPPPMGAAANNAKPLDLVPKAVFARYIGRVMITWLDCGPEEHRFPLVSAAASAPNGRSPAAQLAGAIANTAEIPLRPREISNIWYPVDEISFG